MRTLIYPLKIILLLLFIYPILLCKNAHAYLDPGSGSFFIQLLIGFLVAIPMTFTAFWGKMIRFFRSLFKKKNG